MGALVRHPIRSRGRRRRPVPAASGVSARRTAVARPRPTYGGRVPALLARGLARDGRGHRHPRRRGCSSPRDARRGHELSRDAAPARRAHPEPDGRVPRRTGQTSCATLVAAPFLVALWNLLLVVILVVGGQPAPRRQHRRGQLARSCWPRAPSPTSAPSARTSSRRRCRSPWSRSCSSAAGSATRRRSRLITNDLDRLTITPQATLLLLVAELTSRRRGTGSACAGGGRAGHDVPGLPRHSVRDDHLRLTTEGTDTFTYDSHRS